MPTARLCLLCTLLAAPVVAAAEAPASAPRVQDAPRVEDAPREAGALVADAGLHIEPATQHVEPDLATAGPRGWRPVAQKPQTPLDAPVSAGAWTAYGSLAAVPLGGVYGASRLRGERLWVTASETLAGGLVGSLPGTLLFLQPPAAGGRWTEPDVVGFGVGMVLTPPAAALGTWGLGELAFNGSQHRGRAFLGALGGAAAGTLLGVAMHGVLEEVVGNRDTLKGFRKYVALGFIGSGSTLGYQWAGGGPRPPPRR